MITTLLKQTINLIVDFCCSLIIYCSPLIIWIQGLHGGTMFQLPYIDRSSNGYPGLNLACSRFPVPLPTSSFSPTHFLSISTFIKRKNAFQLCSSMIGYARSCSTSASPPTSLPASPKLSLADRSHRRCHLSVPPLSGWATLARHHCPQAG